MQAIVKTGISVALPDGCYGRIAPRSGLAAKHHIDIGAGVIDKDYRGTSQSYYHIDIGAGVIYKEYRGTLYVPTIITVGELKIPVSSSSNVRNSTIVELL